MKSKPTTTALSFPKLHKKWKGVWWRKALVAVLSFAAFLILLAIFTGILQVADAKPSLLIKNFEDIFWGIVGAGLVTIVVWFRRTTHNELHYAEELQWHVNHAQSNYRITPEEAAGLLEYRGDFLITIDNFFRYVNTKDEARMLPRIQRFGTVIIPHENAYLRITLYWQTGKGFFLTEEAADNLAKFA